MNFKLFMHHLRICMERAFSICHLKILKKGVQKEFKHTKKLGHYVTLCLPPVEGYWLLATWEGPSGPH